MKGTKSLFPSLIIILMLMAFVPVRGQGFVMSRYGDTTFVVNNYSSSKYLYGPGQFQINRGADSKAVIVTADGRPFSIKGSFTMHSSDHLIFYDGPSTDYPVVGIYTNGSPDINLFFHNGAATVKHFSSAGGTGSQFTLQICFPSLLDAHVDGTTTTGTTFHWNNNGNNSNNKSIVLSSSIGGITTATRINVSNQSYTMQGLASGAMYTYYVRTNRYSSFSDTGSCAFPAHHFRTPRIEDCDQCDHNHNCIDYTALNADMSYVYSYKGSNEHPDSALCNENGESTSITARHAVHNSVFARDPRTGNLLNEVPTDDTASVRLGNWSGNHEGESIMYEIHVDTNDYNLMMLRYAPVFLKADGTEHQQPRFSIRLTDENCRPVEPLCYNRDYFGNVSGPDWHTYHLSTNNQYYVWHDWMAMAIDLSPYHGKTLYLSLTTCDGKLFGSAYAYFTLHCSRKQITGQDQCGSTANTFYAPEGFRYRWYKSDNPDSTLSTVNSLTVVDSGLYECFVSAIDCADSTCGYTIPALACPRHPKAAFDTIITSGECQFKARFINRSKVVDQNGNVLWTNEDCQYAYWDFGNGETSDLMDGETTYDSAGTYFVTLISGIGDCEDTIIIPITLEWRYPVPIIVGDTHFCPHDNTTVLVQHARSFAWNYPSLGISGHAAPDLNLYNIMVNDTAVCTILDSNACTYVMKHPIIVHETFNLHISQSICQAQLDSVWSWRGHEFYYYNTSGDYTYNESSVWGCDSTVTLHLTVNPTFNVYPVYTFCDYTTSYPYPPNSPTPLITYDTIGQHTYTFHNNNTGCDSIVHMTMRKHTVTHDTIHSQVCRGYAYDTLDFHFSAAQTASIGLKTQTHTATEHIHEAYQVESCDSTMTLLLNVYPQTESSTTVVVQENNLPFLFNGIYFHDETDTIMHRTNRYGCDSSIHLVLHINRNTTTNLYATICDDALPYTWNGLTYTTAGTQSRVLTRSNGADSVVVQHLTVNPTYNHTTIDTICDGESYTFCGVSHTTQNTYTYSLTSDKGCDSVETLILTVGHVDDTPLSQTICSNHPLTFAGQQLNTSGIYTHTFTNMVGCDSTVTLTLTVKPVTSSQVRDTVNQNDLPHTFLGSTFSSEVSDQVFTITNHLGCDSTIHYWLTINWNVTNTVRDTICASQLPLDWDGTPFSANDYNGNGRQTVVKSVTLANSAGADSIVTRILTINPVYDQHPSLSMCGNSSIHFADSTIAGLTSGLHTFLFQLTTVDQCDSIVTLSLTVVDTSWSSVHETIVENQLPYTFNGVIYSAALLANGHDISDTIVIANAAGCDSTIYYTLTIVPNVATTVDSTVCRSALPLTWNGVTFAESDYNLDQPQPVWPPHHQAVKSAILTANGGSDSIVTMTLHVNPTYDHHFHDTICDNGSISFADSLIGNLAAGSHLFPFDFTTTMGCDSAATLHLAVNPTYNHSFSDTTCGNTTFHFADTAFVRQPAGESSFNFLFHTVRSCDSAVTLNLFTIDTSWSHIFDTIVENQLPYTFNGAVYDTTYLPLPDPTTAATHVDITDTIVITNAQGCDSTIYYHLCLHLNRRNTVFDTVCESQLPYVWDGSTFPAVNITNQAPTTLTITNILSSMDGADSVVVRNLRVFPTFDQHIYDTICDNASLTYDDSLYTLAGDYRHLFASAAMCDSAVTLHLALNPTHATGYADTTCDNMTYLYGDSTLATSVGTTPWSFMHSNIYGCDSTVTLQLTVDATTSSVYHDTIVENQLPYTFNGAVYDSTYIPLPDPTTAATHVDITDTIVITNAQGCDSTIYYHLCLHLNRRTYIDSTICENSMPFTWQGALFDTTAVPTTEPVVLGMTRQVTYSGQFGEDSVVVLHLTVNPNTRSTLSDTVVHNQLPFTWNGVTFDTTLTAGNDRTALINRGTILVNADGCDSITTMMLTVWLNRTATADSTLCENSFPLMWNGTTFDSSDFDFVSPLYSSSKDVLLLTTHGADSLLTMNVTLSPNTYSSWSDTIYERQLPFTFNGYTIDSTLFADTNSLFVSATDTVTLTRFSYLDTTVTIANTAGCDSVISYRLHVVWNVHNTVDSTVCSETLPLQWNARTFTQSVADASPAEGRWRLATLYDTLPASNGADSILAMRLHVMPSYTTNFFDTVCESNSFVWYNDTLIESGIYQRHFITVDGCDSAEYLNFSNFPNYNLEYFDTICDYSGVMRIGVEYIGIAHLNTINLCDSNETYHLWGLPVSHSTVDSIISDHQLPLTYNGMTFSDTADAQARFVLINQYGCDSIINFSLTVMPTVRLSLDSVICDSQLPLTWDGTTFDATDFQLSTHTTQLSTKIDTLHTIFGADSIITRNLTVHPTFDLAYVDTTCNGAPYPFGDSLYNVSGTYIHNYLTVDQCDSTETLSLQVNAMSHASQSDTIVQNQLPYTFGGVTFTSLAGVVDTVITILNTVACDSVITYSLTVLPNTYVELDTVICDDLLPLTWDGLTFAHGDFAPGAQTPTLHSTDSTVVVLSDGTDSVTRYHVAVNPTYNITDTVTACDSYTWIDSVAYSETTTSPVSLFNSSLGCDSARHLNLTIHHSAATTDSIASCDPYTWIDSLTYDLTVGGITHMLQTSHGCDSLVTLDFTKYEHKLTQLYDTICFGIDYTYVDTVINKPPVGPSAYDFGFRTINGCDSIVTLNLEVLAPPQVKIDTSYDCETRTYTLTANTSAAYMEWNSFPEDPSLAGQEHNRTVMARPITHELYMLFVDYSDAPTCPNGDSIYLSPLLKPHAVFEYTPEFLTIDQPHLQLYDHSTNEATRHWWINGDDYGNGSNVSYFANVTEIPTDTASVTVMLTASHGVCHDTSVAVIPFRKAIIWAPNTFTPDESSNKEFFVRYVGITDYEIHLYTRGGVLVWTSKDMLDSWDGTYKGKPCPQDTYVWIIHYRDVTAPRNLLSKKGTVTLLR